MRDRKSNLARGRGLARGRCQGRVGVGIEG